MGSRFDWFRWRPTPATVVGGLLVVIGFLLSQIREEHWSAFALMAAGTFGPGMLRELGWLRDQDEFQRRAAHRAGYHAFVLTGFVAFATYGLTRTGRQVSGLEELPLVFFVLLWFTWMFSSLFTYWGPRRTAFRVLMIFGVAWGLFNIAGNLRNPVAMAMQLLVTTVPFFALGWISLRWPRVAGALLVSLALSFLGFYFYPGHFSHLLLTVKVATAVLFVGPLLASGAALLSAGATERADEPSAERGDADQHAEQPT